MTAPYTLEDIPMQTVTQLLLEEGNRLPAPAACLVLGGEAALPNALAESGQEVHWLPIDVRERNVTTGNVVVVNDAENAAYDRVVMPAPPDRTLVRRWLMTASEALLLGGVLIVAGANAEGGKSVIADAGQIFGAPVAAGYRQKHRIARFTKPDDPDATVLPAWASEDGILPGSWARVDISLAGEIVVFETQPGVFAADRLDAGTALLLEHLQVQPGERVLDVGCGLGVIGILASRKGAGHVDMVDANLLAVQAAGRNLTRLGCSGRVMASDVYSAVPGERYDLIVSNPPFHRGKQVDSSVVDRLIGEAAAHLAPGGRILIVANAFLAYGKQLERVFRQVETVAATRQYHVLIGREPLSGS
jgi:16S rRNA (guanine1207-N2)-methyltransferase